MAKKNLLSNEEKQVLKEKLSKIINRFDVPMYRKKDIGWLTRNLSIHNSTNKFFPEAQEIIQTLYRSGER